MFPTNHKTIFVLDHTPYFGISSENPIDFDVSKSRGPGYVPLPPVCKSLWTCSVEAAVEYCRIVWDLFPEGKLVRFIVSDSAAHILNTWVATQQNLTHILNGLCLVGAVRRGAGGDVVGLCAAIESLSEPSPTQSARPNAEALFQNKGRIICITSARDDDSIRSLAEIALNALIQQNKKASSQPSTSESTSTAQPQSYPIQYCHLVIINVTPEKAETRVNNQPLTEMGNGLMGVEVIVSRASGLATLLGRLVLPHYKLVTTTVTGIPMKEEQNASSSANYDVEIIHSAEAHAGLRAAQTAAEATESVVLRWWTPRGAEGGAGGCAGALWRVTPADVASRPSACLVNFLLNGRSVTLEVPRKGGGRSASHVLAAQGGELWIGALGGRAPHHDPPALSEGAGGRVTDYRYVCGRCVQEGGGRSASHVLAAQGGELWIGALGGRAPHHDPPALSEGAGGRVTDYRYVCGRCVQEGGGRSASHVLAAQGGELWIGALGGRAPHHDPPALSEGAGGRVTDYRYVCGRCVQEGGGRSASHVLAAQGGELWIGALGGRAPHHDPPALSEGAGGRVTDYRYVCGRCVQEGGGRSASHVLAAQGGELWIGALGGRAPHHDPPALSEGAGGRVTDYRYVCGRCVQEGGGRSASHVLAAQGGELWIGALGGRAPHHDPPALSEGAGGRVTDYRYVCGRCVQEGGGRSASHVLAAQGGELWIGALGGRAPHHDPPALSEGAGGRVTDYRYVCGRCVQEGGGRSASHVLAAQGGELWIGALGGRAPHHDPPALSEGAGGRVTDYRYVCGRCVQEGGGRSASHVLAAQGGELWIGALGGRAPHHDPPALSEGAGGRVTDYRYVCGRCVQEGGGRSASHVLAAQGGELWIGALGGRAPHHDPPALSEGAGGRVTDYRYVCGRCVQEGGGRSASHVLAAQGGELWIGALGGRAPHHDPPALSEGAGGRVTDYRYVCGRCVQEGGGRSASHVLAAQGGELWIGALGGRAPHHDPPALSEGAGGRVTDYRYVCGRCVQEGGGRSASHVLAAQGGELWIGALGGRAPHHDPPALSEGAGGRVTDYRYVCGRCVQEGGGRSASHVLAAQGGELWIGALGGRAPHHDPPALSEGAGGRVTDYRYVCGRCVQEGGGRSASHVLAAQGGELWIGALGGRAPHHDPPALSEGAGGRVTDYRYVCGRCVQEGGGRSASHVLAAQGGELWIGALGGRAPHHDPPALSEGAGGRVTDYRYVCGRCVQEGGGRSASHVLAAQGGELWIGALGGRAPHHDPPALSEGAGGRVTDYRYVCGRCVQEGGGRSASHVLAAQGGELWIGALGGRAPHHDPPALSEGAGGRVTDYRYVCGRCVQEGGGRSASHVLAAQGGELWIGALGGRAPHHDPPALSEGAGGRVTDYRYVCGRCVQEGGGRSASHVLAAQGGELWIGALGGRAPHHDPPALSEGAGGRVTDYRYVCGRCVQEGGGRSASHVLAAQGGELWIGALGGRAPHHDPPALSEGAGGRVTDYRYVCGRCVQEGGGRSASHVLAAQGGELWIGALGGRAPHHDPPALSEGAGGRVTDYRIKEFGALMQQNRLFPLRGAGANARAKARLQRHTTYWPLTISSTLVFNLGSVVEPLTRLVVQETLTDEQVDTCRGVLLALLGMESRHEFPTPHPPPNMRGKSSSRREEQWRQVWSELEALVRAHAAAPQHRALLRTLLECRAHNNHPPDSDNRATVIRATTDSPLSPVSSGSDVWQPRNVLDALLGAPRPSRRPDFAGRMAAGNRQATLYAHLQQDVEAQH